MSPKFFGFLTALIVGILSGISAEAFEYDTAAKALGSIGFYSNGCLDSESKIDGTEAGLHKLFVERNRGYGNPSMIELLVSMGSAYYDGWQRVTPPNLPYERIQLGDITRKGGGFLSKHASHQTGLDVDVVYMRNDFRETREDRGFDASFDEYFVKAKVVTKNLDAVRTWWLWRFVHRSGKVDRIFVDPSIKAYFCHHSAQLEPDDQAERFEVLRMLRPYPEHADHFHMRLVCPSGDRKCVGSKPVPPGPGCTAKELESVPDEMGGSDHHPTFPELMLPEAPANSTPAQQQQPSSVRRPSECSHLASLARRRG
ncbi:MAG: penicillin-insensitive murein endopeptidase [Deltaproteobacteria bacterium]|nr:penicillin-insensitive murein endopeptidase [Deltaproteobacteria bacterium]